MLTRLLIVADDFTGALDTGVQFASRGLSTRVVTDHALSLDTFTDSCEVLVVDAETRHLAAERAYHIVYSIASQTKELGIPYIYKKTDSALRGNVGAELTALLKATGQKRLPFLPAFPQTDRITAGGIHYINGVPVAESVFGKDPFEPVIHSQITDLIAAQSDVAVTSLPAVKETDDLSGAEGIVVFDAASSEDLERTGRQLLKQGGLAIMAGCAGFGSVLPKILNLGSGTTASIPHLDPNFLVICGSVNPITVGQLDRAEQEGFLRIRLEPKQKLDPAYWATPTGEETFQKIWNQLDSSPWRILDTNDAEGAYSTAEYAAQHGMSIEDVRQAVSRTVGYLVSRLFPDPNLGTLLITGGDTLLQCMKYMGVQEIEPLCELDAGVVLSRFTYQSYTRYVISKSGGFGREELLTQLAKRLA